MDDLKPSARLKTGLAPSRRDLLAGLAALGAGALLPEHRLAAQQAALVPGTRFDFHHHFASPRYLAFVLNKKSSGYQTWEGYSVQKQLDTMDKAGVTTSFLSMTTPGIAYGNDEETRALARDMNDFAAKLISDYKGRFALFAVLPLPNIDASLREIEYAFDKLGAIGIGTMTSYNNKYLGDPMYAPILEEINRRKAIFYTHPIDAPCCQNLIPNVGPTVIEYNTDTSRTIASIIVSGAANRTPDITYIFSHAGGTMPYLVERFGVGGPDNLAEILARTPNQLQAVSSPALLLRHRAVHESHSDAGVKNVRWLFANRLRRRLSVQQYLRPRSRPAKMRLHRPGTTRHRSRERSPLPASPV